MSAYLHNRLTYVWALLTAITLLSWGLGRGQGADYQVDALITVGVLLIAAVKAQFVIMYFMEVRNSAAWLKKVAYGWVAVLFLLLLFCYWYYV